MSEKTEKAKRKNAAQERAAKKLKGMGKKGGSGEFPFDFLSLSEGRNVVRVFRTWREDEEADFYKERMEHKRVGPEKKGLACRKSIGKKCFACEKQEPLYKKAKAAKAANKPQKEVDSLFKKSSALRAKPRFFMNAIVLKENPKTHEYEPVRTAKDHEGEKAEKPEVFGAGPMIQKEILAFFTDDEADIGGVFWEDGNRYDFVIKKTGEELDTEYKVIPTRKYAEVDTSDLEKNLHDLDDLFSKFPTYEEGKAIVLGEEYDPENDAEAGGDEDEEAEGEDSEEEGDEDEEKPSKKKKGSKKKDEDEEDAEEDEDSDDDSEDEDEEDAEEDEDSDDDSEDEDEEDAEEDDAEDEDEDEDEEAEEDEDSDSDDDEEGDEDEDSDDADEDEDSDDEDEDSDDEEGDDSEDEDEEDGDDSEDEDESSDDEAEEEAEDDDGDSGKPVCFGDKDDYDPKDATCKKCKFKGACAKAIEKKASKKPEKKPAKKVERSKPAKADKGGKKKPAAAAVAGKKKKAKK